MDKVSYEELDKTVQEFQCGMPHAAGKLIEAYDGFLTVYVNLLNAGIIFPDNDRMRQFISLYISRYNIRKNLDKWMFIPNVKGAIYSTAKMLMDIFQSYKKSEIYNEVVLVLLELAQRYVRGRNPTFHLYVSKVFNFYLKKHLEKIVSNPLLRNEWISYEETADEGINTVETDVVFERIHEAIEIKKTNEPVVRGRGLNLNWINGVTATSVFKILAPLDRDILVKYYIENMTDEEIADELGYGARETVNRRRNKAKAVIERYVQDNNLYRMRESDNIYEQKTTPLPGVQRQDAIQLVKDSEHKVKTRVYCAGVVG